MFKKLSRPHKQFSILSSDVQYYHYIDYHNRINCQYRDKDVKFFTVYVVYLAVILIW